MSIRNLTGLAFLFISGSLAAETLTVTVLNESGEKVDSPSAFLLVEFPVGGFYTTRAPYKISNGLLEFKDTQGVGNEADPKLEVYVVAKGYAFGHARLEPRTTEAEVILKRGKDIVLELIPPAGKNLPEGITLAGHNAEAMNYVWWGSFQESNDPAGTYTLTALKERHQNRFTFTIPESGDAMYFAASVPGINRAFLLGPYDPDTLYSGQILVSPIPQGGALSATFQVPQVLQSKVTSESIYLEVMTWIKTKDDSGKEKSIGLRLIEKYASPSEIVQIEANDLPAQKMELVAGTGDRHSRWDKDRIDYFISKRGVTIHPDKPINRNFVYETSDLDSLLKGNHHADITIKTLSGTAAANSPWKLHYSTNYGAKLTILEGTTNEDGLVTLRNLDATKQDGRFSLVLGEKERFTLNFSEEPQNLTTTFTLSPQPGDRAPEIQGMELATGKTVRLSDHLGKVVLVDFWATWCGPCQPGMQHNAEMALKNTEWKDKVVILPVSCDDSKETLVKHVEKKGWGHLPNVWLDGENVGWEHPAMGAYGVRGIPTVVLVDQTGTVAWKGHPGSVNLEEKINELLEKGG